MSFLLPYRRVDPLQNEPPDLEAQAGSSSTVPQVASLIAPDNPQQEQNEHDDAAALLALDEAYFVTPAPQPPLHQSSTLLPCPLAKVVSATTGLGTLTIRGYARVFEWGLGLGRETSLRSLELTRAGIEGVLRASAKDVSSRREADSELARADTENVLARSISALHWAFTGATFATAAGFKITETYLQGLEITTLQGLSTLNAILGSTESSRAVSAIVTLIKEELTRPGAEDGLVPGYWDLIVTCAGFVMLQRWGRRRTALEFKGNGGEETIWDLVIDDKGFRADVVGTKREGGLELTATKSSTSARMDRSGLEDDVLLSEKGFDLNILPTIQLSAQEQTNLSDEEIRDKILAQLPPGTRAVVSSNTLTLKTVQVDIHGRETVHIEAPPGLTMISEHLGVDSTDPTQPHQRIVFRTSLKRSNSAEIDPIDRIYLTNTDQEFRETSEIEDAGLLMTSPKRRKSLEKSPTDSGVEYLNIEDTPSHKQNGRNQSQKKFRKRNAPVSFASEADSGNSPVKTAGTNFQEGQQEKAGIIRKALHSLTPSLVSTEAQKQLQSKPNSASASRKNAVLRPLVTPLSAVMGSDHSNAKRVYPAPEGVGRSSVTSPLRSPSSRSDASASYFTVHERKRESTISQTDSFSIHSADSRAGSPVSYRTHARTDSGLTKTKSHTEMSMQPDLRAEANESGSSRHHFRSRSFVPSLYSMSTKNSDEAIILQPKTPIHRSVFEDHKMSTALANNGKVPGMFPDRHLVKSIRRFARFASASYGSNFLRVMGITNPEGSLSTSKELIVEDIHHEHSSFATHTGLPADTILLSGFCDPKGGTISTSKKRASMTPLMHFISVDHDSKAIVLTCRGTLGFEDVLTDMICDYDDFYWQGQVYQVHKGIHASARRMLDGGGRRVMSTIQASLEEFPDYGLVLCGHSLGGSVAAVLALLIAEPNKTRQASSPEMDSDSRIGPSFVTAAPMKLITDSAARSSSTPLVVLPAGRPIHVFAYGPPATFSAELRLATRGLITTIINHNDIIPSLSLGTLHDFKAVAVHLKKDPSSPLVQLRSSMIERVKHAMLGTFWHREETPSQSLPSSGISAGEAGEEWQWTALGTIRNLMINDKLLPPGEVFIVETSRVFDRLDASDPDGPPPSSSSSILHGVDSAYKPLGRPATRVQFKLVRNVESRFREVRFGSGMFGDHSPGRYEGGLGALERGLFAEEI